MICWGKIVEMSFSATVSSTKKKSPVSESLTVGLPVPEQVVRPFGVRTVHMWKCEHANKCGQASIQRLAFRTFGAPRCTCMYPVDRLLQCTIFYSLSLAEAKFTDSYLHAAFAKLQGRHQFAQP